jgi:O-antigen ligase
MTDSAPTPAPADTDPWLAAAGWSLVLLGGLVPLSVAGVGLASALVVLLGLVSGLYRRHWRLVLCQPVVVAGLLLFAWLAAGLLYGAAPWEEALRVLKKYRELLLIPLLMPLFLDPRWRRRALQALALAMLVTLALSYAKGIALILEGGLNSHREGVVFQHRITQNVFMALFAFWVGLRALRPEPRRWPWWLLLVLILLNLFVLVGGRTGQMLMLALAGLALYSRYRWRALVGVAVGGLVLGTLLFATSSIFRERVMEVGDGLDRYRQGDYSISTALRLSYYRNALELVAARPLLGYGVGGFAPAYQAQVAGTPFPPVAHAHNEYLTLAVQGGLPAAGLLLWLFWRQWRGAAGLSGEERLLAQGLVLCMALGCLLNSFLLDSPEGHAFAYLSALLLAPRLPAPGSA